MCEVPLDDFAAHCGAYVAVLERVCSEADVDVVVPPRARGYVSVECGRRLTARRPAPLGACAQSPLRYVLEVLRCTDVCRQGSWPLGLQLLRLVRVVLTAHPTAIVFGVLKDILAHLTQTYGNVGRACE